MLSLNYLPQRCFERGLFWITAAHKSHEIEAPGVVFVGCVGLSVHNATGHQIEWELFSS